MCRSITRFIASSILASRNGLFCQEGPYGLEEDREFGLQCDFGMFCNIISTSCGIA